MPLATNEMAAFLSHRSFPLLVARGALTVHSSRLHHSFSFVHSIMADEIPTYPQVLINVPIEGGNDIKKALMEDGEVRQMVEEEEKKLGDTGRVLVRASGTEALIRIMVESADSALADSISSILADYIRKRSAAF